MSRSVFALALVLLAAAPAAAQIRQPGVPAGLSEALGAPPVRVLAEVDVARYLAEDAARGDWPLRYGAMVHAGHDVLREGRWDVARDGSIVVRLAIESRGAYSLGLEFDAFHLPEGAQLFLYDEARANVLGAYTSANHREDSGFVIEPFPGERVIVEVRLPEGVDGDTRVVLGDVVHDYRDVRGFLVGGPSEPVGGCLLPANCPQGNAWGLQKRATVRTLSGGGLCSAALINNTANDGTRYVLTAHHCGQEANTIFTFNYQHSGCGTGPAPTNQTVSGATVLVTNSTVDSRLMRIDSNIPPSYAASFAGWSRQTQNSTYAVALGHPHGGPKMISIDNNGSTAQTNMWVVTWHEGNLQGGSSGGPLFDQNGRVRGPACCVSSFSCNQTARFGRFDRFWTLSGLAQWLDPIGANPTVLDAFDPSGGPGGLLPQLDSVVPSSLLAVYPDGLPSIALFGQNLGEVHTVEIDGVDLGVFQFTVVNANQVNVVVPRQSKLGAVEVRVSTPLGSATAELVIEANPTPVIDVFPSDPQPLLTAVGAFLTIGSQPGDLLFLLASNSDVPSILPGIIETTIGNNFLALFELGWHLTDATKGWNQFHLPLVGLPPGAKLHFQVAKFPGAFPLEVSNVQSGTILF